MTIDTKIRHVTKPGANVFLELGFSADEAKRLHAASQKQIERHERCVKERAHGRNCPCGLAVRII